MLIYIVVGCMACILLLFIGIWVAMCVMNDSGADSADKRNHSERSPHVTSIYNPDTNDAFQNDGFQCGCTSRTSDEPESGRFQERNSQEMCELSDIDNTFPTPPPSSYFHSTK